MTAPQESKPTVLITNAELLNILAGSALTCGVSDGTEVVVRLPTPDEFLAKQVLAREYVAGLIGQPLTHPPSTRAEAEQLCQPVDIAAMARSRGWQS